jgi:hypothetical protein
MAKKRRTISPATLARRGAMRAWLGLFIKADSAIVYLSTAGQDAYLIRL